jgi:putative NADPH-quinone reductase
MKVFVVIAHPEHQSFNGAMFRTAVETLASAAHEVQSSDLHAMQFDPVSGHQLPAFSTKQRTRDWDRQIAIRPL